eukprot:CAMPEP_0170570596 /NCGR_PEP_ID=MMETSP0224-20130122/1198_1 /TAXON_ID=285029 /ORGANISM="Togula jolla, Strain CCCM 725" /LENGTH=492 /DNA_ID=CAMNT_0010892891 /DNA_START=108 /DNA_END=1582 /DNA_ORIENTATION=-
MQLDGWCEEVTDVQESLPNVTWDSRDTFVDAAQERSECWEALQAQIRVAEKTGSFVFAHRILDDLTAVSLSHYLRHDCSARFIDLSYLGRWREVAVAAALAVKHALRGARSLILDGNEIATCAETLEAWCSAVEAHPGIQQLSLRGTGLDDKSVSLLAEALRQHSVLFWIDLGLNRVGDRGISVLTDAVADSSVLLEVNAVGTDASEAVLAQLASALEHNGKQFRGRGGRAKVLSDLKMARAEAMSKAMSSAELQPVGGPEVAVRMAHSPAFVEAAGKPAEAQAVVAFGADVEGAPAGSSEIFFDAGKGITEELSRRCEASWRYSAADQERLCELRRTISDALAHRQQERDRAEEVLTRLVTTQCSFNEKLAPHAHRILELKTELAEEVEDTKHMLQGNIRLKLELQAVQEELELTRRQSGHCELNAKSLDSGLKNRNREVAEDVERLQHLLHSVEESIASTVADNERCQRHLSALRFDPATEGFKLGAAGG